MGSMPFTRRLVAATIALVLAVFPVALERCRTACVTSSVETAQTEPSAQTCHEASAGSDNGARMDSVARACGHGEARTYESARLGAAKTRTMLLLPALEPLPHHVPAAVVPVRTEWSQSWSGLSGRLLPLNSPLRL